MRIPVIRACPAERLGPGGHGGARRCPRPAWLRRRTVVSGRAARRKARDPAPTSRAETVADHRRALEHARAAEQKVIEIAELCALEDRGALRIADTKRLIELLKERARDWSALGRAIPLAADLRHIVALDPTRARPLGRVLGVALRAAGDVWLALGENARAEEEYSRAQRLGADGMDYRLRAAWGASPADLDAEAIERAVADLPERVLAPFVSAYLDAGGAQPRLLRRAWMAARVYGPPALQARIEATPAAAGFKSVTSVSSRSPASPLSRGASEGSTRRVTVIEPGPDEWLFGGPTLARTLLPLAEMFPDLLAPGLRSRMWADRLIAEDPTSPDSLEVAALIDARAGRLGGAARKLGDLVYYSADRAAGYERTARVWRRVGQVRRACVAFENGPLTWAHGTIPAGVTSSRVYGTTKGRRTARPWIATSGSGRRRWPAWPSMRVLGPTPTRASMPASPESRPRRRRPATVASPIRGTNR